LSQLAFYNDFASKKTLFIVFVNKAISSVQLVNFHTHCFRYSLRVELTCKIRLAIFSKKQYLGIYLVLEIAWNGKILFKSRQY